ncbi:amino acid ABC transporter ATP-binding protein [Tsukamurella sp. 1534]|uniref:amino acid ABC transporter ATP-binding protein n=1 Tax=Tsukamurella sp. 1534 TaxID=1151061 RepID=UPI00031BAC36|nr:amino acid ABC transporter ATP-binding protein [Tsukamurella sp. 1534]
MTDLISVRGLTKSFGDRPVLRGIDFAVPEGTVTVVIGPSGSGKTTVLRSLNALELPDGGTVTVGSETLDFAAGEPGRAALARYRAQSAMVFQSHNLFPHKTALENVTEGPIVVQRRPAGDVEAEARALLDRVGLADHADKYPHQLSGGQQQRVGIARALALRPKVVLFDEPTSALDPELVGGVLTVMRDLATEGRTMVVVTHEMAFARDVADQVLFVDGGKVLESGPPAEVIGDPQQARTREFLDRILHPL